MNLSKLGNAIGKGATVAAHVAAGSFAFGATVAITNWHPTGVSGLLWNSLGITAASAIVGGITRWAKFDPSKVR